MIDVDIPEVREIPQTPRFYRDGENDFVEISFVGIKDTVVQKVKPEHMAKWREAWDAYCDGRPMVQRKGTPLTELVDEKQAQSFISRNVHSLEEFAALSDIQCQGLGHGTITLRKKAREMVVQKKMDGRDKVAAAMAHVGSRPAGDVEIEGIKSALSEQGKRLDALGANIDQLVGVLSKLAEPAKKRGRPRKEPA